jgi:hypothetical protein
MTGRKRESEVERKSRTLGLRMALMSERRLKRLRLKKSVARANMTTDVATMVASFLWSAYEDVRLYTNDCSVALQYALLALK